MNATRMCPEHGCDRESSPKAGFGMCARHYERMRQRRRRAGQRPIKIHTDTPEEKFYMLLEVTKSCWWWTGPKNRSGYGIMSHRYKHSYAHRWSWEHLVGAIPKGMTVDHLCTNKLCVNPEHLEVVTLAENSSRRHGNRVFCPRGHSMDDAYDRPDGDGRMCRGCQIDRRKAEWQQKKAKVPCEFCGRELSSMNMRSHVRKACKNAPIELQQNRSE